MNEQDVRLLDIRLAMAFEFKVENATMYSPEGTLLGGDFSVHIGSMKETNEHILNTWLTYTPRFTKDMNQAMWLLEQSRKLFHTDYNLFQDDDLHTCEFGFWINEAGKRDQIWSATEDTSALAIAKAVAQSPVTMGAWAIAGEKTHRSFGLSDDDISISVYGDPDMSDETKAALLNMAKAARDGIENGTLQQSGRINAVSILINGQNTTVAKRRLTYEEIVQHAFPDVKPQDANRFTVQYTRGTPDKPCGVIQPGQAINLVDGIVIDAVVIN